jgi:hypothetical protein
VPIRPAWSVKHSMILHHTKYELDEQTKEGWREPHSWGGGYREAPGLSRSAASLCGAYGYTPQPLSRPRTRAREVVRLHSRMGACCCC